MRLHRPVLLAVGASLLSSAAPPTPRQLAAQGERSPVRCRTGQEAYAPGVAAPFRLAAPPAMVSPPPPPPPSTPLPPPPPAETADAAGSIVVTASSTRAAPSARRARVAPYGSPANTERYAGRAVASVQDAATAPVSTFSVDVDTGAYANARRFLRQGRPVPAEAVRTEEFINYFRYDYPRPADRSAPFSVTTDVATTPWNADTRLLRIGLRAYDVTAATRPAANLVFLVDVSGSMDEPDKLPLVKTALEGLAGRLTPRDRVSIVVYAGQAGIVLEPTGDRAHLRTAIACLQAGGSTAGGEGIALAYATARRAFLPGGVNRILLATDGDFNVGISDDAALEALVKRNRDDGVTLTTLGFGTGNYNEAMMERIADAGNGNYSYIDGAAEADKVLGDELSATLVTVAKDVKVQIEFDPAHVSQYRLIGYENRALREQDFTDDAVDAGDIGAGHQVTALYEFAPAGSRGWTPQRRYPANRAPTRPARGAELAFVKLRYKLPGGGPSREIARAVPAGLIGSARPPAGDMAFATAVAAFGQKLRGDTLLGRYGYPDIRRLAAAGTDDGRWRQEFARLTELAETGRPSGGGDATAGAD